MGPVLDIPPNVSWFIDRSFDRGMRLKAWKEGADMKFENRETQFRGKKKIIKVDNNNIPLPGEAPILVNIHDDDGTVYVNGTPISAENLNKGNWRDDKSLSFKVMENGDSIPESQPGTTQIFTDADGETYILPAGVGRTPIEIGRLVGADKQDRNITFTGQPSWSMTGTIAGYAYRGQLPVAGALSVMAGHVFFNPTDAASGNYSAIAETYDGGVYVYSKINPGPNITITGYLVRP